MDYRELLAKIAETAERRDCLLMEWREEFLEVLPQIQEECGHWQGLVDDNGEVMLGRLFHKLFDWKYYNIYSDEEYHPVPFHCYAITPTDVLFTKDTLQWDELTQQYTGPKALAMRMVSEKLTKKNATPEAPQMNEPAKPSGCMAVIVAITLLTATLTVIF